MLELELQNYHEINQYRDALFPVGIYQVSETGMNPFGRGLRDFHWHDELQFTLAVRGSLTLQVDAMQYELHEGEAALINSGMIHAVVSLSEGGRYASLNFPYKILSFFPGSRMEKEYVIPFVTGSGRPVILLRPQTEWQQQSLDILQEILEIWNHPLIPRTEYLISTKIVALWNALLPNLLEKTPGFAGVDMIRRQRLQAMLSYIYEHFSEDIRLSQIAGSVHISISECCRIFREHLQTTPYQFLTEYRVRKSIELLSGDLSISEIAGRCGYNQVSNYIAKFKSLMDCTPAQYRRRSQ